MVDSRRDISCDIIGDDGEGIFPKEWSGVAKADMLSGSSSLLLSGTDGFTEG
ncbi:MAG: hypothetical protein JNK24_06745 [Alphaproteobacteria bacterium]|nr:hypothetical protein [Alphaproteobacteria bacterium]